MTLTQGTHILQQVGTLAEAKKHAGAIAVAVTTAPFTTLCFRTPWNSPDWEAIHTYGVQLAHDNGLAYAPRTMAGRYTPKAILDAGPDYTWTGADMTGRIVGPYRLPLPCNPDGSPNRVFERAFVDMMQRQDAWADDVNHGLAYGRLWAEVDFGAGPKDVTSQPGNSLDNVVKAHLRLYKQARAALPGKIIEFPLSGHGPAGKYIDQVTNLAVAEQDTLVIFQMNGWQEKGVMWTPNQAGISGPPGWCSKAVGRAFQAFDTKPDHDWTAMYDRVEAARDHYTGPVDILPTYAECYLATSVTAISAQHIAEVGMFNELAPTPDPDPEPEPEPGEWHLPARSVDAIQQLYSPTTSGLAAKLAAAMKNTDGLITGFGTRIPAKYPVIDLMDDSLDIAEAAGLKYRPRTMMGGHIPDDVKAAMGSRFLFDGSGAMQGSKCPRPTDGTNVNQVFLDYYRTHVQTVFNWCAANGVDLFNVPTVGMAYSELYFGPEVQNDPDGWLEVHKMLVNIVADEQTVGVTAGWGLSGHGPYFTTTRDHGDMGMALAQHIKATMPAPDQSEGQGNGWGPNGIWGQSASSTEEQMDHYLNDTGLVPGAQAIQPWKTGSSGSMAMLTEAQWAAAFMRLDRIGARQLEIYLDTPATDTTKRMVPYLTEFLGGEANTDGK